MKQKLARFLVGILVACSALSANAQFVNGQVLTATQLINAFSNTLQLTGGTLTGPLTVPSLSVTGTPIPLASGGTGANAASGATLDNISGFSGTGYINRTGAGAYSFSPTIPATVLSYTGTGTGAVAQVLSNRFAQVAYIDGYSAAGNGTTDDSTPLINAAASLGSSGGTVFLDCTKNYAILSNVTIPANVTIQQCRGGGPWGNPGVDWGSEPLAGQPHINLSTSATLTFNSNSGYDGVILAAGTTFPVATPAAFVGTAMKLASGGANDVHLNALIVGFATCVDGTNGGDHQHWNVECDGNPASGVGAVIVGNSADTSYFHIRTYPWGTVGAASATLTRTGIGTQVIAGPNADSRMDLFDYGHAIGVQTSASGDVHYTHVWVDTNSTWGLEVYNNSESKFDAIYAWTTPGIVFFNSTSQAIDYLYCNSNGVIGANCIVTGPSSNANLQISNLNVAQASSYGINVGSTGAHIAIGSAVLTGINGGAAPYIVGPSGWTSDQVQIAKLVYTDLPGSASLIGANIQNLPPVASAALLAPPVAYDHFQVTGSTTITNIGGVWDDRRIILTFVTTCTLTNNSNISLTAGSNLSAVAGTTIALWYDQPNSTWREMWHH